MISILIFIAPFIIQLNMQRIRLKSSEPPFLGMLSILVIP